MHPHAKKVVMMTSISLGIIIFAYMIPVFVVPVALKASDAAGCTDYGCANSTFTKCGGYSAEGSSNLMDSWKNGVDGMLCMMGLDSEASVNVYAGQITLNKV
jgi:hypothetical protein